MAKSYYSTVIDRDAATVWSVVRDFGDYEWAEGVGPATIEDSNPANTPGAVRNFEYYDAPSRQRLVAHSDAERRYTYASTAPYETLRSYEITLCVEPVVDGDRAFVAWWADFEAPAHEFAQWDGFFQRELAKSLEKLRGNVAR